MQFAIIVVLVLILLKGIAVSNTSLGAEDLDSKHEGSAQQIAVNVQQEVSLAVAATLAALPTVEPAATPQLSTSDLCAAIARDAVIAWYKGDVDMFEVLTGPKGAPDLIKTCQQRPGRDYCDTFGTNSTVEIQDVLVNRSAGDLEANIYYQVDGKDKRAHLYCDVYTDGRVFLRSWIAQSWISQRW